MEPDRARRSMRSRRTPPRSGFADVRGDHNRQARKWPHRVPAHGQRVGDFPACVVGRPACFGAAIGESLRIPPASAEKVSGQTKVLNAGYAVDKIRPRGHCLWNRTAWPHGSVGRGLCCGGPVWRCPGVVVASPCLRNAVGGPLSAGHLGWARRRVPVAVTNPSGWGVVAISRPSGHQAGALAGPSAFVEPCGAGSCGGPRVRGRLRAAERW